LLLHRSSKHQGDKLDLTSPEWDAFGDYDSLDAVRDVICKYTTPHATRTA